MQLEENFEQRIGFSISCKELGNTYFKDGDFTSALVQYERALSVWEWIETRVQDWRRTVRKIIK